jgi:hypothetical protein
MISHKKGPPCPLQLAGSGILPILERAEASLTHDATCCAGLNAATRTHDRLPEQPAGRIGA